MSRRHDMVTRTFRVQTYELEAMTKTGEVHKEKITILGQHDMQQLRDMERKKCQANDMILLDLKIIDQGSKLYALAISEFLKHAKCIR